MEIGFERRLIPDFEKVKPVKKSVYYFRFLNVLIDKKVFFANNLVMNKFLIGKELKIGPKGGEEINRPLTG